MNLPPYLKPQRSWLIIGAVLTVITAVAGWVGHKLHRKG